MAEAIHLILGAAEGERYTFYRDMNLSPCSGVNLFLAYVHDCMYIAKLGLCCTKRGNSIRTHTIILEQV